MSTFCGIMPEINYISIDRFDGENLKSLAFFLSHCHVDHMRGMSDRDFELSLRNHSSYIYMSNVSKSILEKMYPYLKPYMKELDMYSRNIIEIPTLNKPIVVSLIPAAHCPGSVMFLFETDKTILYTGDIRIRAQELEKCKLLYDATGQLKSIDNIYLDTTFFMKCYDTFPLRCESVNAICELISDWLAKRKRNQISLITPAKYGYEHLFAEIYKKCGLPIHVDLVKYNLYNYFPEMDKVVTLDASRTNIHNTCIGWNRANNICITKKQYILQIKPSALSFRNFDFKHSLVKDNWGGEKGVCYATHSSYSEIWDILKLLKPTIISACVVPTDIKEEQDLEALIREVLKELHEQDNTEDVSDKKDLKFVNKTNWCDSNSVNSESSQQEGNLNAYESCEENSDICNIMDSPDLKKKKYD